MVHVFPVRSALAFFLISWCTLRVFPDELLHFPWSEDVHVFPDQLIFSDQLMYFPDELLHFPWSDDVQLFSLISSCIFPDQSMYVFSLISSCIFLNKQKFFLISSCIFPDQLMQKCFPWSLQHGEHIGNLGRSLVFISLAKTHVHQCAAIIASSTHGPSKQCCQLVFETPVRLSWKQSGKVLLRQLPTTRSLTGGVWFLVSPVHTDTQILQLLSPLLDMERGLILLSSINILRESGREREPLMEGIGVTRDRETGKDR